MAAKTTITVTYRRPGTQPPIFIAGEFSDPPWNPQEMDYTTDEDGEHTFKKDIEAYAGSSVQYKFRVGLGDWWVLNENAPTATDSAGFLNNVAEVPAATDADPTKDATAGVSHDVGGQDTQEASTKGFNELQTEPKSPVADAGRVVINPYEAESTSGADTPAIAETAAEVADTAALIDDDADVPTHDEAPTIKSTSELQQAAEASSGPDIDTPVVAQTAAEVADTAALIDGDDIASHEEAPTPKSAKESSTDEPVRSASGTNTSPITETAAEVADTAAKLDKHASIPSHEAPPKETATQAETHPEAKTGTDTISKTADEVADTAAELDRNAPLPTREEALTVQSGVHAEQETEARSEPGTSTSAVAKTADEVADTAAILDEDAGDAKLNTHSEPQVASAAKELLGRAQPSSSSGTSTPSFVRTAAEVADSAALLDGEEPEEDIPDEEAGRIGFRRMSTTPIPDVAATAAEVADTAQRLDDETIGELELRPTEAVEDAADEYGFNEPFSADSKAPLFAHECVGMDLPEPDPLFEGQEDHKGDPYDDEIPSPGHGTEYDTDNIDLNDPTLERFPSNREEIIDAVRKLEGGMNEDRADVEGLIPASPIVGPSGPQNHDALLGGDLLLMSSPIVASPVAGRGSRLLELPGRASLGSVSSDRLSAASLGSISEAEEEEATHHGDRAPVPALLTPKPGRHQSENKISPTNEEDEGVAFKVDDDKPRGSSPETAKPEVASGVDVVVSGIETADGNNTPASDAKTLKELEGASDHSGTQTPAAPAPSNNSKRARNGKDGKNGRRSPLQRSERNDPTKRSAAANAWAAAVQVKDATTNRELLAHRDAQNQELQAQGLSAADVQAPIKDTWRPTKLDDDGTRKNKKAQEQVYHATKATGLTTSFEAPAAPGTPGKQQDLRSNEAPASPCFVAHVAGEAGQASTSSQGSAGAGDSAAKASGAEIGPDSQVKKRRGGPERTGTPISVHDTGIKAAQGGNWFRSFFRIIFVDFIGGILNRLFGRKRET